MADTYAPYQRLQSGIQRRPEHQRDYKDSNRTGTAPQTGTIASHMAQVPLPVLCRYQCEILSGLLSRLCSRPALEVDPQARRLYPLTQHMSVTGKTSLVIFIRQPVIYTTTVHVSGSSVMAAERALNRLCGVQGQNGHCKISAMAAGRVSLMGRYSCDVYDQIRASSIGVTGNVAMISFGGSAVCAYLRYEEDCDLLCLSAESLTTLISEAKGKLHVQRGDSDGDWKIDLRLYNTEHKGTRLTLKAGGYMSGCGALGILEQICSELSNALTRTLAGKLGKRFIEQLAQCETSTAPVQSKSS